MAMRMVLPIMASARTIPPKTIATMITSGMIASTPPYSFRMVIHIEQIRKIILSTVQHFPSRK
jgi:hypothetical protein